MLRLGRTDGPRLDAMLAELSGAELTYAQVGATRTLDRVPAAYHVLESTRVLHGVGGFERAREGLRTWRAHVGAGARVYPGVVARGATALVVMGVGPLEVLAPCRIVYVVDEPGRFGFAYGTLPGHPESGEESFVVEGVNPTTAELRITAFSRPAEWFTRLLGPVGRRVQGEMATRYGRALQAWVADDRASPAPPPC